MKRLIAMALALVLAANGLAMLLAPLTWYGMVPGVPYTGPFNAHFVRDIGAAYLTAGAGVAWFAWRPGEGRSALASAAAFLTLHGAIHLFDATCGPHALRDVVRDFAGVHLIALVALGLVVAQTPERSLRC